MRRATEFEPLPIAAGSVSNAIVLSAVRAPARA